MLQHILTRLIQIVLSLKVFLLDLRVHIPQPTSIAISQVDKNKSFNNHTDGRKGVPDQYQSPQRPRCLISYKDCTKPFFILRASSASSAPMANDLKKKRK